ncbi:MAG: DUF1559 domain-containing protein [Pirellulaceae bacterium]
MMDAAKAAEFGKTAKELSQHESQDLLVRANIQSVRELFNAQMQQAPPLPAPFQDLAELPNLVDQLDLRLKLTQAQAAQLLFSSADANSAKQARQILEESLKTGQEMIFAQIEQMPTNDDPVETASQAYAKRMTNMIFQQLKLEQDQTDLSLTMEGNNAAVGTSTVAGLTLLLLPAVNAAREAARRNQAINTVKQLCLAMLNYESARQSLPAYANFDEDNKPLLSWRVHILPYLEENELYNEFHLDEPWDSDHNIKLIDRMPEVYRNPNLDDPTMTNFLVPVGEGTIFDGTEGRRIREITDGTSKTILIVEANAEQATIWTKPQDLEFSPKMPMAGLGSFRPGGFIAGRADGSVGFFSRDLNLDMLKALFTCDAGDMVQD